ncbi:MAG: tyrosine-type recombinase/integrase [Methylocella sp.]
MDIVAGTDLAPYTSRFDRSRYDRTPSLTDAERQVIERWVEHGNPVITSRQAPRLYEPLADALLYDGRERSNRLRTIKFLLMEVGRSGQPHWSWNEQHWLDLVNSQDLMTGQLLAAAYLLCDFKRFYDVQRNLHLSTTARLVFSPEVFNPECERLMGALERVGFKCSTMRAFMPSVIAAVALEGGDPRLESFNKALLERTRSLYPGRIGSKIIMLRNGLAALGFVHEPIHFRMYQSRRGADTGDIHQEWMNWCRRWLETSTLQDTSRQATYNSLLRVGIWLVRAHPDVTGPEQWTVDICADFLAAVDRLSVGEWAGSSFDYRMTANIGKPLQPQSKIAVFQVMRRFLADVQSWEWVRLRCNPRYHLATPRTVLRLTKVNPRSIDDAVWLKLIWASLNLEPADLIEHSRYPFELLKAMAVVWTHAGLRSNEIVRLRLGCVRPQSDDLVDDTGAVTPAGKLCYLDVPAGKTSASYSKPINSKVGAHIEAWTQVRPPQRMILDRRTGERVGYLFQIRNRSINSRILNNSLIPILCVKAGVGPEDSMGPITSHRGRASAVTALASVPQGMTLFELAKWCGHSSPQSTMSYVRSKPTQLASAFAKADRMAHMIEVVIDQEAITSGGAGNGTSWKYYDLGDSYCSNAFWSTCPHRMTCAGCFFNVPKQSAKGLVLDAQGSATRLLEEVWLSPGERAAVEGDVEKLKELLAKLRDIPALDGRTPEQIDVSSE